MNMTKTKTVTVDVPIEVRKSGPDEYRVRLTTDGYWSGIFSEAQARNNARLGYAGALAIVQAIDSGEFVEPLPIATNTLIHIKGVGTFVRVEDGATTLTWFSTTEVNGRFEHTSAEVQTYGPFEVLYDPEAKS